MSTIAVGMPERACAATIPEPISPAPETPTRFTALGTDRGIAQPRVASQPVLHEEDGDQVGHDRRAVQLLKRLSLDLQPFFQGQVAAVANRLRARPAEPGTAPWSCP